MRIPTSPVFGIKKIPIMHKIVCHIQDMKLCTQDIQYNFAVSYRRNLLQYYRSRIYRVEPSDAQCNTSYDAYERNIIYLKHSSCVVVVESNRISLRIKHIAIKYHHLQLFAQKKIILICLIDMREQTDYISTKPLD